MNKTVVNGLLSIVQIVSCITLALAVKLHYSLEGAALILMVMGISTTAKTFTARWKFDCSWSDFLNLVQVMTGPGWLFLSYLILTTKT